MAAAAVSTSLAGRACFPGDVLSEVDAFERVVLGPGVAREDTSLVATRVGVVRWERAECLLWVESDLKRYWPGLGDHVIGIVTDKGAEDYKLDIGASSKALLPVLAFDGASKRNRPHLAVGALVYARVVLANKDMEPEVTCAAPPGVNARDWVTKESVFGELSGGHDSLSRLQRPHGFATRSNELASRKPGRISRVSWRSCSRKTHILT